MMPVEDGSESIISVEDDCYIVEQILDKVNPSSFRKLSTTIMFKSRTTSSSGRITQIQLTTLGNPSKILSLFSPCSTSFKPTFIKKNRNSIYKIIAKSNQTFRFSHPNHFRACQQKNHQKIKRIIIHQKNKYFEFQSSTVSNQMKIKRLTRSKRKK